MLVYRYEFNGKGPYNADGTTRTEEQSKLSNEICCRHTGNPNNPGIYRDELFLDWTNYTYSACDSLESLKKWFYGFNVKLKKLGFKIAEYEVPTVEYGKSGKQVAFDIRKATKVRTLK